MKIRRITVAVGLIVLLHFVALLQMCGPPEIIYRFFDVENFEIDIHDRADLWNDEIIINRNRVVIGIKHVEPLFSGINLAPDRRVSFINSSFANSPNHPIEVPRNYITSIVVKAREAYGDSVAVGDDITDYFLTLNNGPLYITLGEWFRKNKAVNMTLYSKYAFPNDVLSFEVLLTLDDARTFQLITEEHDIY